MAEHEQLRKSRMALALSLACPEDMELSTCSWGEGYGYHPKLGWRSGQRSCEGGTADRCSSAKQGPPGTPMDQSCLHSHTNTSLGYLTTSTARVGNTMESSAGAEKEEWK